MPTARKEEVEVGGEVAALIRRIARGGPAAETRPQSKAPVKPPSSQIEPAAARLLESLPPTLRLVALRGQFPRVLNRIAHAWHDPRNFAPLVESLLIDERGHRQGFPFEVINEITELREYYFTMVHPEARRGDGPGHFRGFR